MPKINKPESQSSAPLDKEARIKAAQGKSSYRPAANEMHLYHIKMDRPVFDPASGVKKGPRPYIQKFTVQDWKNHLTHGQALGYTTEIMWNPEAYAGNETPEAAEGELDDVE